MDDTMQFSKYSKTKVVDLMDPLGFKVSRKVTAIDQEDIVGFVMQAAMIKIFIRYFTNLKPCQSMLRNVFDELATKAPIVKGKAMCDVPDITTKAWRACFQHVRYLASCKHRLVKIDKALVDQEDKN